MYVVNVGIINRSIEFLLFVCRKKKIRYGRNFKIWEEWYWYVDFYSMIKYFLIWWLVSGSLYFLNRFIIYF